MRVAFDRPEVRNAFRPHTVDELYRALDHARMSPDVGVVLLTGNGPSPKDGGWAFCSGGDQRIRGRSGYQYAAGETADTVDAARAGRLHILEVQRLIRFMPKVVICLVNGWAAGGGHSLHVVCDLTLASREHARFKQTDADVGSFDGGYGSAYLARQVGQKFAREIFFLGRAYTAEQMHHMGAVNEVVDHAELETVGIQWAAEINAKSPQAQRMLKFAFNLLDDGLVGQQLFAGRGHPAGVHDRRGRRGPRRVPGEARRRTGARSRATSERRMGQRPPPRLPTVSKSPLRRFTDQLVLATMRPPTVAASAGQPARDQTGRPGRQAHPAHRGIVGHRRSRGRTVRPHGATVVVVARRQDLLDALADRITAAGGTALSIPCDVSDMDAVDALVADVEKRLGGIDILINNAGRSIRRPLAESLERWHDVERTMVLNYYAPLRLIRGLAPGMLERGDGHIINVSTWGVLSEASPLFARLQRVEGRAVGGEPRRRNRVGPTRACIRRRCTTRWWPLPMIAPTKAYDGHAGADVGRSRRVDGHRRPHPAGADRAADGDRRQGAGHLRPPLGQRASCSDERCSPTAQA